MTKEIDDETLNAVTQFIIEKYLPWLLLDTDFLKNGKIRELTFSEQRHFIGVLTLKRAGKLDKNYYSQKALDTLVASHLEIGRKTCQRLHLKLQTLDLVDGDWQPLGWKRWQYERANRVASETGTIVRAQQAQAQRERKKKAMTDSERQRKRRKNRVRESVANPSHETCHEENVTCHETCHEKNVTCHETCHEENVTCHETCHEKNVTCHETCHEKNVTCHETCHEKCHENDAQKQPETRMDISFRHECHENSPLHIQEQEQEHVHVHVHVEKEGEEERANALAAAALKTPCASATGLEAPAQAPLPPMLPTKGAKKIVKIEKASRLSTDWQLPRKWGEWALETMPHFTREKIVLEAEKFADYWHSRAGVNARKCDWEATWRNWIRKAAEYSGQRAGDTKTHTTPAKPKPQPLSFKERDLLREIENNIALGLRPAKEYQELKRRADAYDAYQRGNDDRTVIDISSYPQHEGISYACA